MKKTTQNNGITLVALVITIIVLLILAMVTINILINQGIIGHANNAVRGYEVAEEKELIGLGYQNYKMDKLHDSDALLTVDGANGGEGIPKDDDTWYITFDKTGHTYALTDNGNIEAIEGGVWTKNNDGSYTKGDVTLKVGDYVAYDPMDNPTGPTTYTSYSAENASSDKNNGRTSGYTSDQTFDASAYTNGWRVLSIKGSKVELISASVINPISGGVDDARLGKYCLMGKHGYTDGTGELQGIASIYGHGKGAIAGRNLTVEEINSITGYNPSKTGNGEPYGKGKIYEYGNNITFYWNGNKNPYYEGDNGVSGNMGTEHKNGFYYYDGDDWQHVNMSTTATNTSTGREKITTLKSTAYSYRATTLTTDSSGDIKGLKTSSAEYSVLFLQGYYWLASTYTTYQSYPAEFGMRLVVPATAYPGVSFSNLQYSYTDTGDQRNYAIRPVITLLPKAQIKAESGQDGTTAAKAYSLVME